MLKNYVCANQGGKQRGSVEPQARECIITRHKVELDHCLAIEFMHLLQENMLGFGMHVCIESTHPYVCMWVHAGQAVCFVQGGIDATQLPAREPVVQLEGVMAGNLAGSGRYTWGQLRHARSGWGMGAYGVAIVQERLGRGRAHSTGAATMGVQVVSVRIRPPRVQMLFAFLLCSSNRPK